MVGIDVALACVLTLVTLNPAACAVASGGSVTPCGDYRAAKWAPAWPRDLTGWWGRQGGQGSRDNSARGGGSWLPARSSIGATWAGAAHEAVLERTLENG